jgi:hypothetical protein
MKISVFKEGFTGKKNHRRKISPHKILPRKNFATNNPLLTLELHRNLGKNHE